MTDKRSDFELITGLRAKSAIMEELGDRANASRLSEAADRIEELAAENERLREALKEICDVGKYQDAASEYENMFNSCIFIADEALKGQDE